ncbi:MAG: hypothetical protein RI988_1818, partial [Pseudomonadota bacterium]
MRTTVFKIDPAPRRAAVLAAAAAALMVLAPSIRAQD